MSTIPPPVPDDPYANKAIVAAAGTVVTVLLRWAVSGEFQFTDEGLITLAGAITTLAVYAVTNWRRLLSGKDDGTAATLEGRTSYVRGP
jgi:hypothetical protein